MEEIIARILSGDSKAIVDFYRMHYPKIFRYLKNHLPKEEDAQEVANDVFFDAIDSFPLLKDVKNTKAWLFKIAHNKVADYYRKSKVKSLLLSQLPFLEIVDAEVHQPEFLFEKDKIRDRIEEALKNISHKNVEILRLHYEEKMPVKEIASVLNLSFKATESLLYRARKSFKVAYERA